MTNTIITPETANNINELINNLINKTNTSINFASEQIPSVLQEVLKYNIMTNSVSSIIGILAFMFFLYVGIRLAKKSYKCAIEDG